MMFTNSAQRAFSLVELLVALALLGLLSTFMIPKLLNPPNSTLSAKQTAMARDTAFMLLAAYEQYRAANPTIPASTTPGALIPYLNYTTIDTSGTTVDAHPGWAGISGNGRNPCNSTTPCLKLHNGGVLFLRDTNFGCTTALCTIEFALDPDTVTSGSSANSATKSLQFQLYYDGTIRTRGTTKPGSCNNGNCGTVEPNTAYDPSWFTGF